LGQRLEGGQLDRQLVVGFGRAPQARGDADHHAGDQQGAGEHDAEEADGPGKSTHALANATGRPSAGGVTCCWLSSAHARTDDAAQRDATPVDVTCTHGRRPSTVTIVTATLL